MRGGKGDLVTVGQLPWGLSMAQWGNWLTVYIVSRESDNRSLLLPQFSKISCVGGGDRYGN